MKRSFIAVPVVIVIVIIAYLAYDYLIKISRPCESIFEQTALSLGSKLETVKTKGGVFIERERIQELTELSQQTALNLKTCCILLHEDKITSDEFLKCKAKFLE